MFTLVYTENTEPRRFSLPPGDTVVGRAPTCDLVVDDASVSRWHARFKVTGDVCQVTDVGSRNGTYVNGVQVNETAVTDGDQIVLGRLPVTLERSAADKLTVSEDHALIDPGGTIYRPVGTQPGTVPIDSAADAPRLLKLLSEIAGTLVGNLPLNDVLNRVVDLTFETVRAERAFLMLYEEGTPEPVPKVVRRRDGSAAQASISRTIVTRVKTDRVAVLAADVKLDPQLMMSESIQVQNIRSLMCAPLWHKEDVIGLLYVDTPRSKKFAAADLDLFTALANYAAVAIDQARMAARVLEETRRRERLQRYHAPAVVARILQGGSEADAPFLAMERDISVIFLDIVGFTAFAEGRPPQEVARLLNAFFTRMADVIFEFNGTLDKFIGDAILAVFGAPLEQEDHAARAVRAAQAMRQALAGFNEEQGAKPWEIRIAIHSGLALTGDIGSPRRRDYTVLGDVVNTAARLQSEHTAPGQILISSDTHDRLKGQFAARPLGIRPVRGRQGQIEVFELL